MNTSTPARILSSRAAAARIGKADVTLRQWRSRGMGPPYIRQGRSISYLESDIDQYLAEHRCGGSAPKAEPEPQPEPARPRRRTKRTVRRGRRRTIC